MEIFSFQTLSKIKKKAKNKYDLEHVTPYIRKNPYNFKVESLKYFKDFGFIKVSLDKKVICQKLEKYLKALGLIFILPLMIFLKQINTKNYLKKI